MKQPAPLWPVGTPPAADYSGEDERARVLASYGLDQLADDPDLAQFAQFARQLCGAPIALVSLVERERQRFLAREGLDARETPRNQSFCAHAMLLGNAMVVLDAREDARFADNPLVTGPPHIRFYAGQPLISHEGAPLGTLCVIDTEPRPAGLTQLQSDGLATLAKAVMLRLSARREELVAAREAEQGEARLKALADSIPAIAWSADGAGRFEYFNQQMLEFTGDPEDKEGKSFHPDDWPKANEAWQRSLRTGEPYQVEHRMRRHDGEYRWMISRAVPVRDEHGAIVRWFGTAVDIHDLHAASDARDLLAKELSHRIKNIFAVVAGLVSLSARSKPEHKPFADELTDTIRALGRAHDFIRASQGSERDSLHGLLRELFAPYGSGDGARVRISGHDCPVTARAATPLALVFHELATNAAKYGALSKAGGHVDLALEDMGETLRMTWSEHGGPPPKRRTPPGFGSRLVEMSISGQLGGSWERRFEPTGMVAELNLSTEAVCGCS